HTGTSPCDGDVYVAWARFTGVGASNVYFSRSTDHGETFSKPALLTQSVSNIQDTDISVTGNGHVYITFDEGSRNNGQTEGVGVVKSVDCGVSFSRPTVLVPYTGYAAVDVQDPQAPARPSQPDDPVATTVVPR
ncbi:MAG TPA: sialidase family protein, partial [Gaiellaceae bacterium]|nr:sialidase family protein [Gaiellaceae bacterium]